MMILLVFFKDREEALAGAFNNRSPLFNFGYLKKGWKEINDMGRSVSEFVFLRRNLAASVRLKESRFHLHESRFYAF